MATTAQQTDILAAINATPIACPFRILVDSREQQPFSFSGLRCDSGRSYRPIAVQTEWACLGNFGGDYSIRGFVGFVAIERKSMADFHNTVLGWGDHRRRFEQELENLDRMAAWVTGGFATVVVESSWGTCLDAAPQWGVKTADENRRAIAGSVRAWRQRFNRVQWEFCDTRRLAEETCFDHLRRFWNWKVREGRRKRARKFRGMTL